MTLEQRLEESKSPCFHGLEDDDSKGGEGQAHSRPARDCVPNPDKPGSSYSLRDSTFGRVQSYPLGWLRNTSKVTEPPSVRLREQSQGQRICSLCFFQSGMENDSEDSYSEVEQSNKSPKATFLFLLRNQRPSTQ